MNFLDFIKAFLFGLVEGITEWLPVSSTGHMIILEEWLNVKEQYGTAFWDFFLVAIQLGAIIAVVICFFNKLWPFGSEKTNEEKKLTWHMWFKVILACLPAAVIGLLFDDQIEKYLNNALTVSITLIIYGVLFIILEIWNKRREFKINEVKSLTYRTALIIGFIQLLAVIPGTSRSGVTILGAMLIGCNRTVAAEFSFFLSIPVMFGASLLKGVKFFMENSITMDQTLFLTVGLLVAFGVSILVIRFLMNFIKKHDFKPFGYYRIALGILLLILFLTNIL